MKPSIKYYLFPIMGRSWLNIWNICMDFGLGMKKKITLTAMLATTALVVGFFAIDPNVVNNTVQAAKPAEDVNVVNTPLPVQVVNQPSPVQTCPRLEHLDKIEFRLIGNLLIQSSEEGQPSPLLFDRVYDIKVTDDPLLVRDLNQTVADFLNAHNYEVILFGNHFPVSPEGIDIVDVEYAIACPAQLTPPP